MGRNVGLAHSMRTLKTKLRKQISLNKLGGMGQRSPARGWLRSCPFPPRVLSLILWREVPKWGKEGDTQSFIAGGANTVLWKPNLAKGKGNWGHSNAQRRCREPATNQAFGLQELWGPSPATGKMNASHLRLAEGAFFWRTLTGSEHTKREIKKENRASLVAQWLRIHLPMQGAWVQALAREDPTCRRATKPMRHNYRACALEPTCHNYWSPHA